MVRYILMLFFFFPVVALSAQELSDVERLLESHKELYSEDEYSDIIQTLLKIQLSPVNVNSADFDTLKMLFFLSDSQIDHILSFRKKYGTFLHFNELLLVPGISKKDLDVIRPFIQLEGGGIKERLRALRMNAVHEWITRIKMTQPKQEGYKNYSHSDFKTESMYDKKKRTRFLGPPIGLLSKYKVQINKQLQFGFTLENDPGEAYFTRYQKTGFDFLSAHWSLTTDRFIRRLVLGDFRMQWGQGLVMWSGFSSGKSSLAVNNEKSGSGVSPYTSADENRFLRGFALTFQPMRGVTSDLFFSYKKTDGNIILPDSLAEEDMLTATIYEAGYHRNQNECEKKHTMKELTTGLSLKWNTLKYKIGAHVLYYHFTPEIQVRNEVYSRYNDNGHQRWLGSVDYKTGFRNIYLYGETAISEKGVLSTVNGLRFSGSSKVAFNLLYRYYDKKYVSRYASGFSEYSNTSNEEGLYAGVTLNVLKGLKINAYYDRFRFLSPRYNAFIPASGNEILCELIYAHRRFEHSFRYKREVKPENFKAVVIESVRRVKNDLRYQLIYKYNKHLESRTRLDMILYSKKGSAKETGYLVYNDLVCSSRKERLKMQLRLAYFHTDSYQSRIYAYENNVLYGYSFPAYYDEGFRTYLNLTFKTARIFTFYLKAGLTVYSGREEIGSSLTKVNGNKLYDFSFQVRAKF
ncbi:helix-hairpin-helix domain-containing protein [Porphyromonadaceae bacterium OttesenSCG-928-L07]|nr:helix-hairpin-helix domain-containing protein [Porphyromonadaceae bacterium OttesenSCG-928-L07]MDL2252094.1 helix-hairpin-helix domain-containing protein [Odoribacter sp. OttesenSCG-928-J03]MDL2330841.1 helix-hairpin-helix domain-containing protein [Odoribacter sp. OttesenSCG-928-A06]